MRLWRGANTKTKRKLTTAAKSKVRAKMQAVFSRKQAGKGRNRRMEIKQERLANKYQLLGFDEALRVSTGIAGLQSFQAKTPCKPLKRDEHIYYVPIEEVPAKVRAVSGCRTRRACFEGPDKKRRLCVNLGRAAAVVVQCAGRWHNRVGVQTSIVPRWQHQGAL